MKKILIMLTMLVVTSVAFAQTAYETAMKQAVDAQNRQDYYAAEKLYGVAAVEFNKLVSNAKDKGVVSLQDIKPVNTEELRAHMADIRKFNADLKNVYDISKNPVTKSFLSNLMMTEAGADMLLQNPQMLDMVNSMLNNKEAMDSFNKLNNSAIYGAGQADMLKGIMQNMQVPQR